MDVFDDQGYAWIETTTPADASDGRRTFQRGMKLKPDVQPWTIDTNAGPRVAWIDDQNQEHFMPPDVDVTRRGWRRLYVEKRS